MEYHQSNLARLARLDGFINAGAQARLDRYIGYFEPYATSHDTLDKDEKFQEEVRCADSS